MGVVFLGAAKDGTRVAIKVLRPELAEDSEFRTRFRREVAALTRVRGMCTVRVIEADTESRRPFVVTEYADGPSLAEHVASHGPLGADLLHGLATGLAEALAAIHAAGVVHRDLKPSNVLLAADGPKVIDFGIAQTLDATALTKTGMTIGTAGFMAPEQIMGQAGTASDIFAWAVTVGYAASGRPPFGTGASDAILYRIMHAEPDIAAVPELLRPLVEAALAKEPRDRPAARDLLGRLTDTPASADDPYDVPTRTILSQTWRPSVTGSPPRPEQTGDDGSLMRRQGTGGHGAPAAQPPARRRPVRVYLASSLAVLVAAAGTVTGLVVASQSATGTSVPGGNPTPSAAAAFNAGLNGVVNPSARKGGSLTFAAASTPDSLDPGNTYFPWVEDFDRLFAMPMFTYRSCPGQCGLQLVPDLATSMGKTSDNGLTWTFHIQPDVKFEDGTVVTSRDVKYAIERTYDRSVLAYGPSYYQELLTDPGYPGPYKNRSKNLMGLTAIGTPDATTLVFHLQAPFPDLPYVLAFANSAPVPPGADTGSRYQLHPLSTGPYKFESYQQDKQLIMVPNPNWNPATDPNARQLLSQITLNLNVGQASIDNGLLAGDIDVDAQGFGVASADQARILANQADKARADNPLNGFERFFYISTKVAPLDNAHCREAVEYAADKTAMRAAWGGATDGEMASTVMPPVVLGYRSFDLYHALSRPGGDDAAARQQLGLCGHPGGFGVNLAYRGDRPQEAAAATALQAALSRVGIRVALQGFPTGRYYNDFAGSPAYVHAHHIGIAAGAWDADWPNGYGFLDQLSNGNTITSTGNVNISELNDPVVNSLFSRASGLSGAARTAIWSQIDERIMKDAAILPETYQKTLLYRPPRLANVYVQAYYGTYNYAVLGLSS